MLWILFSTVSVSGLLCGSKFCLFVCFRSQVSGLFLLYICRWLKLLKVVWKIVLSLLELCQFYNWELQFSSVRIDGKFLVEVDSVELDFVYHSSSRYQYCYDRFPPNILSKELEDKRKQMLAASSGALEYKHTPRWIKHHYCAMAMALISLTWGIEKGPDCARKQRGVQLFLKWAIMQGFAMILQNRYQRQRLYTRIALGKARRMDVVWGETAGVEGQLLLLFPVLFTLQGFEAYVGFLYLKTALTGFSSDWQVIVCGILLIIMAVGNFANTVQTLVTKSRVKAKIKKGKSRVELNQALDDKSL